MKRSRSGTAPPDNNPGLPTILLIAALVIVLAFAGSLIFGLRGGSREGRVQPEPDKVKPAPLVVNDSRAKVEVQNGSGKTGLAKLATEQLRDAGFDVVQFGHAGKIVQTSQVIDRVGKSSVATSVAKALGISVVRTEIDQSRLVDATVLLGKDWANRNAPATPKKVN